jgi:hypothetical protein
MGDRPEIYSPDGEGVGSSWVIDLAVIRTSAHNTVPNRQGGLSEANYRMQRHGEQLRDRVKAGDMRVLRNYRQKLSVSGYMPYEADRLVADFRDQLVNQEYRDSSTSSISLGTFTPPQYWLDQFALYRSNAAPCLAAATHAPLPATGMTVDVPANLQPIGAKKQSAENASATGTGTPSAVYQSAAVETYTSQQFVSQQTIDRIGPGIAYDQWHARQAAREIGAAFEADLLTAVVATSQKITNTASASFSNGTFWGDVANASQLILKAPPPAIRATHVFAPAGTLYGFMGQIDSESRPVWIPQGQTAGGPNVGELEGWTGYQMMGSNVYFDDNLPLPSAAYATVLVGAPHDSLLVMEADPIVDVYPETLALTLTASVNVRQYAAYSILFPTGFASITGPFYPLAF